MVRSIAAVVVVSLAASAQQPAPPRFEVVSITPCKAADMPSGGGRGGRASIDPGLLRLECQTLDNLIRFAYLRFPNGNGDSRTEAPVLFRLLNQALEGSPAWVMSDRYTIVAKPDSPQTAATMQGPMLRALLEDRFKLKIRRGIREVPVYALVVGKGGPKLEASRKESCTRVDFTNGPPALPEPGQQKPCGLLLPDPRGGLETLGQTLAGLCLQFSVILDRDVVDRTGIAGTFDIHLDQTSGDRDALGAVTQAVQSLGLNLEPAKASGEFLVIDHVERPEEK